MNKKRILIVDDSEFDRGLLAQSMVRKGGFQVLEAANSDECLRTIEREKVDLVLMDIMMPGICGTLTLMKIREIYNQIELPVIMVTAKSDASDIIGCLQSGANDYVIKPVNFDIALSRICTHLKVAELSREMFRLKELETLGALIATYNHEINNPLAIALGCLDAIEANQSPKNETLRGALCRIADIVQKIAKLSAAKQVEYTDYVGSTRMVKIRGDR